MTNSNQEIGGRPEWLLASMYSEKRGAPAKGVPRCTVTVVVGQRLRRVETQRPALCRRRSGLCKRKGTTLGFPHGGHDQGVGAVDPLVLQPAARVGAGQGTQCHQPRHEAEIGVRFAGPDQLVHLIEAGEVAPRLGEDARSAFTSPSRAGKSPPAVAKPAG